MDILLLRRFFKIEYLKFKKKLYELYTTPIIQFWSDASSDIEFLVLFIYTVHVRMNGTWHKDVDLLLRFPQIAKVARALLVKASLICSKICSTAMDYVEPLWHFSGIYFLIRIHIGFRFSEWHVWNLLCFGVSRQML